MRGKPAQRAQSEALGHDHEKDFRVAFAATRGPRLRTCNIRTMRNERTPDEAPLIPRTLAGWPEGLVYTPREIVPSEARPEPEYVRQHRGSRRGREESST